MSRPPYKPNWSPVLPKTLQPGDRVSFRLWDFREGVIVAPPRWVEHGNVELVIQTDSSYCGGVIKTVLHNPDQQLLWDANWPHRHKYEEKAPMNETAAKDAIEPGCDAHMLDILLDIFRGIKYAYSPGDRTISVQNALNKLVFHDLIEKSGENEIGASVYRLTSRGHAHCKQLTRLPLPVEKKIWANAAGEVIA